MIFPTHPADQDTFMFNDIVYTYYSWDRSWYAAGSNPSSVDPQNFQRRTDFQNDYDVVTNYAEFQKIDQYIALSKKITFYQAEIDKLLTKFQNLSQEYQALSPDREQVLLDLKQQIQDYINHPEPDSIVWPVFPI